jgi:hypothetical protein
MMMSSLQPSPSLSYVQLRLPALASSSCSPNKLAAGAPASASNRNVARLLLLGPRQRTKSDAVSAGKRWKAFLAQQRPQHKSHWWAAQHRSHWLAALSYHATLALFIC